MVKMTKNSVVGGILEPKKNLEKNFQIALFLIGSKSPPIALFLVIFTIANL